MLSPTDFICFPRVMNFARSGCRIWVLVLALLYCAAGTVDAGINDIDTADSMEASAVSSVRGQVLNEVGRPLAGATVLWKGSPYGVTTDAEGNYQLPLAAGHTIVQFSYAGYVNEEVQVRGGGVQNVTLLPVEPVVPASGVREKRLLRSLR